MTSAFDSRLMQVTLDLPGGPLTFNQDFTIYAAGRKYGGPTMAECEIRIYNLTREHQNYILTQASPLARPGQDRTPINIKLDIGRESYGTFRLFEGYAFQCGMTQPPDIGIVLRSLSSNYLTAVIGGANQPALANLKTIAQQVAKNASLTLNFQATDKQINNWSVSGSVYQQINELGKSGNVDVIVDNDTLLIIDKGKTRSESNVLISASTGMVGIPQVTDSGVLVRVMASNSIEIGGGVTIQSDLNPAANGSFKIYQLGFELASRDQPFWYTLGCSNLAYYMGTQG